MSDPLCPINITHMFPVNRDVLQVQNGVKNTHYFRVNLRRIKNREKHSFFIKLSTNVMLKLEKSSWKNKNIENYQAVYIYIFLQTADLCRFIF